MTKQVSTATIYLGTPFYNDDQRTRVKKAMALLEKNPTVVRVHFPFDQNFVDPEEKNPEIGGIRSMTWRLATYNNDITGLVNASCGVFLYDMDNIDDGSAFEIGFMRALHKPVILVPFTNDPNKEKEMNLMLAQGVTTIIDGNTDFEKLATYDFNTTPANPVVGYKII
ncbi:nucleoside 2-deoxyribosyltransferase [Lactobacillus amylovorus DSM 20531]|uniref:nucleoside 2-deoxyribosyltransferase n=1 Tax=Lactobacillus amylovorus TaxID=1604 RepID=UPI0006EE5C26|nr:nucleoside 2-deoxyribosyltransferase [Lactobacillus amylovorus]ATO53494.1 nucleoside 2-deoxyribosyltransferase [Lactobacillus amylovorus DSM 20531]KRK41080.1 nucleoside deoxyribosyltransferase [Lactobacillus amylovorus DSM 20531]MCT3593204.1 nucleoside 2-deoxyribosyltransferase [Lactobacillus amylovorus]